MPRICVLATLCCLAPTPALSAGALGEPDLAFGDAAGATVISFDKGGAKDDFATSLLQAHGRLYLAGGIDEQGTSDCLGIAALSHAGTVELTSCYRPLLEPAELAPYVDLSEAAGGDVYALGTGILSGQSYPYICRIGSNLEPGGSVAEDASAASGCLFLTQLPIETVDDKRSIVADRQGRYGDHLCFAATKKEDGVSRPFVACMPYLDPMLPDLVPHAYDVLPTEKDTDAVSTGTINHDGMHQLVIGTVGSGDASDFFVANVTHLLEEPSNGFSNKDYLRVDFGPGTVDVPTAIAVRLPGDAFVVGTTEHENQRSIAIVKLSADTGDLDTAFNGGLPATINPCDPNVQQCTFDATALEIDTEGRPVIAGLLAIDGVRKAFALRLRVDGTIDTSFAPTSLIPGVALLQVGQDIQAADIALQGDRVVFGGATINGEHALDFFAARIVGAKIFRDGFGLYQSKN